MSEDKLQLLKKNARHLVNKPAEIEEINALLSKQLNLYLGFETSGLRNLYLPDGNETVPYHQVNNAFNELQSELEHDSEIDILVCLGSGFGYQLMTLFQTANAKQFLIVDPLFEPLFLFLTEQDLSNLLPQNAGILYAPDHSLLIEYLKNNILRYHATRVVFISLNYYKNCHSDYLPAVAKEIHDIWERHTVFLNSMQLQADDILINSLENLSTLSNSYSLKPGRAEGEKAIIVGSGPSLDANINYLKELKKSCAIVALGSAIKTLKNHLIEPDFVIVSDPQSVNLKHFPDDYYDYTLVYDPVIPHSITKKFTGKKILINIGHTINNFLYRFPFIEGILCWGTVSSAALSFCEKSGFSEIVFIGSELSSPSEDLHVLDYSIEKSNEILEKTTDIYGLEVYTNQIFKSYARYVNEQIKDVQGRGTSVIVANDGGLISSEMMMSLREYYIQCKECGSKPDFNLLSEKVQMENMMLQEIKDSVSADFRNSKNRLHTIFTDGTTFNDVMSTPALAAFEGQVFRMAEQAERACLNNDEMQFRKCEKKIGECLDQYKDNLLKSIEKLKEFYFRDQE